LGTIFCWRDLAAHPRPFKQQEDELLDEWHLPVLDPNRPGLYPEVFYVFLPTYLANKGAIFHRTQFETWSNYALTNISGIPGPIVAGCMCNTKLGRMPWPSVR
ncbi:hypothetical protein CGMCC3_g16030, partial [Colletotrichum fructicola]